MQWTEWEVVGTFIDPAATVRAILEPEVGKLRVLTDAAREQLLEVCERIGYRLLDLRTTRLPDGGIRATLEVAPILVVRWVDVSVSSRGVFLDDEIRRRLRLRPGAALPYDEGPRQRLLDEETQRVRTYLRDEGYFEAAVTISVTRTGAYGATVAVTAALGPSYRAGTITVENTSQAGGALAIPVREVQAVFDHRQVCLRLAFPPTCPTRFTRSQLQADLEEITRRFQRRGFPAVRVASDFDPVGSIDRKTKTVSLTLKIDERRKLDVVFEGNDPDRVPDEDLAGVLTFAAATTVDDFEVAASARAIEQYYQARGNFDVMVSSERVRFRAFDRVVFRIEPGQPRSVRAVEMTCRGASGPQPCSLPLGDLTGAIGTRTDEFSFFGSSASPTTALLTSDVAALERLYHRRGFLRATARVAVAPTAAGWGAAALAMAEVAVDRAPTALRVRFTIDEGPRTTINQVNVVFEGAATGGGTAADERQVRARLGFKVGDPYVRDTIEAAAKRLEDWYWSVGRPRAQVTIPEPILSADGQAALVTINVEERQELRIGQVIVRGNFRTRDWVIKDELGFGQGELLTGDLYRGGPSRLRSTNLFSSVSLKLLGFDDDKQGTVDVLVRVEERKDVFAQLDLEGGGSLENGWFVRAKPSLPNVAGLGIRVETNLTAGTQYQAAEATLRLPHWLWRRAVHAQFDLEVAGYVRNQITERFGDLFTYGGTLSAIRSWQREADERHKARLIGIAGRYDVRLLSRDEELIRPAGAAGDLTTNPIRTRTGTLGVRLTWDQRRDRQGNLNPLAPDNGFRAEVGVSYASPYLLGQDTFLKLSGTGQTFFTSGRVQLRLDGRYDHGVPLGGAVLLPEVERFFAGGDVTVRGFDEDRLATEIITEPVPPLGQTTQVRVLPAGGNIRALATVDLQATLWRVAGFPVASAIFTDAGLVTNTLGSVRLGDVRPAVGMALRVLLPIGAFSGEYAVPVVPQLGDDPRGRFHFSVALRY
ncbi:MAG: BamA/TamA family outer membrane protein [Myxococcales bacterium]|nr:BamA/TamA family outer membrane protein [Myxococcales bacterium]